jgi:hypothetical protein
MEEKIIILSTNIVEKSAIIFRNNDIGSVTVIDESATISRKHCEK